VNGYNKNRQLPTELFFGEEKELLEVAKRIKKTENDIDKFNGDMVY
jgi:hypothetical protein